MLPPAFSETPDSIEAREYEQLIHDGIIAAKNGNFTMAKKLLDQAALINSADARIWIWLSATTNDLQERRTYLERAVASDPSNTTAKRGLLLINEKLAGEHAMEQAEASTPTQPPTMEHVMEEGEASTPPQPPSTEHLMEEGEAYTPPQPPTVEEAVIKTYTCPNCGASISYDIHETTLVCQFCGFTGKVDQHVLDESTDQSLDAALLTERAHRWSENQTRLTCEQCGVAIILPPGQTADSCPYCTANHFITSPSLTELVDPKAIGLFKIDPQQAGTCVKNWLSKGFFAPDDLAAKHGGMQLHPAYYPFWIFDGTLEIPWFYEDNAGTSRLPRWETRNGSHFENFKDVLITGLRKVSAAEISSIEPFNLGDLVEFSPDFLAGWVAVTYDQPLADASLHAREKVLQQVKGSLSSIVDPGRAKRNFGTGNAKWSGLTYKLALLPIYVGNYPFQGQRYRLLINGQTGKVSGKKPLDIMKVVLVGVGAFLALAVLAVLLSILFK